MSDEAAPPHVQEAVREYAAAVSAMIMALHEGTNEQMRAAARHVDQAKRRWLELDPDAHPAAYPPTWYQHLVDDLPAASVDGPEGLVRREGRA